MKPPAAKPRREKLGPYRLGPLLGKGGTGRVYKAFDERLGRWVAAKRLRDDATDEARKRFRREARTLAQLGHPAIVQIFDVVEDEAEDWIVMELVDGPTLAELRRDGPLELGLALDFACQVASALGAAHASGIVHRDLKAENVMVSPSGRLKVLDFGLARRVDPGETTSVTQQGRAVGTPRAMSPEQVAGINVDERSDLFSFGVLLYEVLTARSPFSAPTFLKTVQRVMTHRPPEARKLNPGIPRELSELVDRMLEKDPLHRPQTAGQVEAELDALSREVLPPPAVAVGPVRGDPSLASPTLISPTLVSASLVEGEATLRTWPPPEVPEQPYPVLLPYTHPDFVAGREAELTRLRRLLAMPVPILGLCAPSGTGKSSLLAGALVPTLRAAGVPVALLRHPAEAGVAERLTGDLLEGPAAVADDDAEGFVRRLAEAERLAGTAPVLVLDQFEDVLSDGGAASRAVIGTLMASSVAPLAGSRTPPCRWLIALRQQLYGELVLWLGDVLAEARLAGRPGVEALPHDLSRPERFHSMTLSPLATPPPGAEDPLGEARREFLAAIEKPLSHSAFAWHFPPGDAERLARVFAEARLARPDAPLAPELQVVLAHLLARAGPDGRVTVPEDPHPLIGDALEDHLRRALETAFPAADPASPNRRARALLALRELADASGQRASGAGLRPEALARAIGPDGEAILEKLATPLTRLVVRRETAAGPRWVLAHDRMAEAVVRLVEEEGRRGKLLVDSELLALRRLVTLRAALYRSREARTSTRMPRRRLRQIEDNAEALLWDDERREWFAACKKRRQADRRRFAGLLALAALVLALVGQATWTWARQLSGYRALREMVVDAEPVAAVWALDELAKQPDADFGKLLALWCLREAPIDVLEQGLALVEGGLEGSERGNAVLRAVEIFLPRVEETPVDRAPELVAVLVWALDHVSGHEPRLAEPARALRNRVLEPLRRHRPPPPLPGPEDPDWIHVGAGSFLMGTPEGEPGQDDERPRHAVSVPALRMLRHEVTHAEYRRWMPEHPQAGGDGDLPMASVDWYEAYTYAAWLGGRLPTEAEWEYAARAGCPHACGSAHSTEGLAARPVMRLEPNPWGLHDMLGNLREWTADLYAAYPDEPRGDPWGSLVRGGRRVLRGGSFLDDADQVRVASRFACLPGNTGEHQGFRVVLP